MFKFDLIPTNFVFGRVKSTCLCTSKSYLAVGVSTGSIYILNIETYEQMHVLTRSGNPATKLAISQDEQLLALTAGSSLEIFPLFGKQPLLRMTSHMDVITALAWGLLFPFFLQILILFLLLPFYIFLYHYQDKILL